MKIFLSWSGPRSRAVAKALNDWLSSVIQAVEPFYSPEIEKGVKWSNELDGALAGTRFGIICLTPDNLNSTWIHYEAGALSKTQDALIWTFLHGLTPAEIPTPLGKFQHTVAEREDVLRLVQSINGRLREVGQTPLEDRLLAETFKRSWPRLEKRLKAAEPIPGPAEPPGSADRELEKFRDLGIETIHDHLTDENLQKRLKGSKDIKVLKTWFPESVQIENGLEAAIIKRAKVRLLLCKPGSKILEQRSLGANERASTGSIKVYRAIERVYELVTEHTDVKIAVYESWPGCPVIWYDKKILMGFYFRGKSSPKWPWISVRTGSPLAKILNDQFNDLWKHSDTEEPDTPTEILDTREKMAKWLEDNKRWRAE